VPTTHPSICRFCHAGCAILVDVVDGDPSVDIGALTDRPPVAVLLGGRLAAGELP